MYGLSGERRLTELELHWLPGYENSSPVRIGNAASEQFQLDVYGELMDAMHLARRGGMAPDENAWRVERAVGDYLESAWNEPDNGIWEMRGPRRHFTHSKVMAWVAVDRMVKAVEQFGLQGPVERWRRLREAIHQEVCRAGFDRDRNTFVQFYGGKELDASLLMIPLVGFLPPNDSRVKGTIEAIERDLLSMVSCFDIEPIPRPTLFLMAKGPFSLAHSGSPTASPYWDESAMPPNDSKGCWICATMSVYSPRNTILCQSVCWETSRKHSVILLWSTRRLISRPCPVPRVTASAAEAPREMSC